MTRIWLAVLVWVGAVVGAVAQDSVPDFRYVMTRDMDFYGADVGSVFDTDIQDCARACTANRACTAFTFNARSNSCFLKSAVQDMVAYQGAFSAVKLATDSRVLAAAPARQSALAFLVPEDFRQAATQARDLGMTHAAGGFDLNAVLSAARDREAVGDLPQALGWTGVAVSLGDTDQQWSDYARLLLAQAGIDQNQQSQLSGRALSAAINGYLRGTSNPAQATALGLMAEALQQQERGRISIDALRLAQSLQPRSEFADALDSAIARYGFRVTGTEVESDSAAPRICVEFSEPLTRVGVDYTPFVALPDPTLAVQPDGNRLCVDGVEHGQRYRLTIREGLPAAGGEQMHKSVEVTQYVRDRSPAVRFPGRSYVLPKSATAALPVETVNLTGLELSLRRVSDRNLLRAMQNQYFGRPLSAWEEDEFATDIAQQVWTGTAELDSELNRDMTTRLPLGEAIAGQPAGIYTLSARIPGADPYDNPAATQWFVLSDLGLSTQSGIDGLHVTVRGLSDAAPRAGVALSLISRANEVLGTLTTDDQGYARFAPGLARGTGGAEPALVLARSDTDDIGFLSLSEPAFDLSDRGVEGRAPAGPVDVFLTTDRGAYRAGETIHVTALARNEVTQAVAGLPLIAVLRRPDGVEYSRHVSDGGQAGGHVFALPVGPSVPRGTWRIDIKSDPDAAALASQTVLVEDFLPERIDFDLALPDAGLRAGDTPPLTITARYLFGAPGADLGIDGDVRLGSATAVAGWPGYRFGRYDDDTTTSRSYFGGERTDAQGLATLPVEIPQGASGRPLEATVIVRLADGAARPVERQLTVPVRPDGPVIGIRPLFDDVLGEGDEARFELIGLGPDLRAQPMRVRWTLNRVETRYQWYQLYGSWNWEPTTRRTRIATGEADLGQDPAALAQAVDWGRYELVVERLDGAYAASSVDFFAGWYAPADGAATPDRLDVSLDRPAYAPGDTARLRIVPRFDGTALVTVMSNHLIERRAVAVTAGENLIPLEVTQDWGTGAYVTATVIRPMDVSAGQNPARALGLAHARVEPVGKVLQVAIDVPDLARPRRVQDVTLRVSGAPEGAQVWATLAAVDLGILNLTGFESPDPMGHYFGQRRLGMELRDVYGRLIDGMNGAVGTVRSGGDGDTGMRMQSPPPTQDLMAVFSGPLNIGADGTVTVPVTLPAFNGTVRLMAVAWSDQSIGQAQAEMVVRDPVVVTASVPRFLSPGDTSRIRLDLVHADGPVGEVKLDLLQGGDRLVLGTVPESVMLQDQGRMSFDVPVRALHVGNGALRLRLLTPGGQILVQDLTLDVRSNDPEIAVTRRFALGAGDSFTFSDDVFAGLRAGTGTALISAGPLAQFDVPGLLTVLDRYPYGCTEQVTSQAMPLLYLSSVAQAVGLGDGPDVQARIDDAIRRILTRQASNGGFGLWRAEPGDFWLDGYVTDFLSRARAAGHAVPDTAFRLALDNLRNRVNYAPDFDAGGTDLAYALMVLAREGAAAMGDLRYYADVKGDAFATPLAAAQLGAALAYYGDQMRADAMFARAAGLVRTQAGDQDLWRADYGTALRDAAGVLALATEAGSRAIDAEALGARIIQASDRMSTQESAWSLLAAQALVANPESAGVLVNGTPVTGPFVRMLDGAAPDTGVRIAAATGRQAQLTLTTIGVPYIAPAAGGTGYAIDRSYVAMDGTPIDAQTLRVGDRFVSVLRVTPLAQAEGRLMIDDPLPAGVEIDNPSLLRSGDIRALDWLAPDEAQHAEFRSDRFLAAVDLRDDRTITLAYVARAVTPGQYHHPAASVEDMYRPRLRAWTDTGTLVIE